MNALAVSYDSYYEAPVTPQARSYELSYEKPPRSPRETMRDARAVAMLEALGWALTDDETPPSEDALRNFEVALRLLPDDLPATEPHISSFGSICLDWDKDPDNQLGIMIQAGNKIAYAAYFSGEKVNGSLDFEGSRLPEELSRHIASWIERG